MKRIVCGLLFGWVVALGAGDWAAAAAQTKAAAGPAAVASCPPASAVPQGLVQHCAAAAAAAASRSSAVSDEQARQLAADGSLRRDLTRAAAMVVVGLGGVALLLALVAVWQGRTHGLRFASYWGGFGGTGTGWQLTPAAVSLLAAALVALAAVALGIGVVRGSGSAGTAGTSAPAVQPAASAAAKS